jgi:hypothetical protein
MSHKFRGSLAMGTTMQRIAPDTLAMLASELTKLLVDQAAYITGDDFKKLIGDDLKAIVTDGRFRIGNLASRTNCRVTTENGRLVFTKNPPQVRPGQSPRAAERHT